MRTSFDFSPLSRSSVGFEHLFDLLDSASRLTPGDNWPPYDILRVGENQYRIAMSVAGFAPDEITITHEQQMLTITGAKAGEDDTEYLYRGIAARSFERRFQLADFVTVTGANLANGMLKIDLVRELPEQMKPRRIEIQQAEALPGGESSKQIEGEKHAA
ncbi:Hsp20 family protein [Sinorhizobium medicae]|uniref:Molecular chaperone Hsp20 n=1 Tax=Sinorhizobium medicae TaxID=110321 RepID=A0ABX4TEU8_9HYPH|nr:Hsp20 family protein [Sinorhizobium medicae]PLT95864.1 molecular chaperone Hsp20 [Sinorhizobium medicae]PLU20606.1 molecular chaperone Hsp20 [Sinorhizobium medicae]PLU75335.1 molecular chaperone Hsp20 [Sinorhizobium medicae]